MRDAVTVLEVLGNCSAVINQTCYINETELEIDFSGFEECQKMSDAIVKIISGKSLLIFILPKCKLPGK